VADTLGAPLLDIDLILVRQMGMPIAQIFGMVGEPRFRAMERDAVKTARAREPAVIVPGGGWAAQPGEMNEARAGSLLIYLKCSAAVAARRSEQGEVRPLVAGADPVERVKALLAAREPYYSLADYEIATDGKKAADVAENVIRLARLEGGW
jgi:shikimate kinase